MAPFDSSPGKALATDGMMVGMYVRREATWSDRRQGSCERHFDNNLFSWEQIHLVRPVSLLSNSETVTLHQVLLKGSITSKHCHTVGQASSTTIPWGTHSNHCSEKNDNIRNIGCSAGLYKPQLGFGFFFLLAFDILEYFKQRNNVTLCAFLWLKKKFKNAGADTSINIYNYYKRQFLKIRPLKYFELHECLMYLYLH